MDGLRSKTEIRRLLPDYPVRAQQNRSRDCDAERLGGLQVDHKFELRRLQSVGRLVSRP